MTEKFSAWMDGELGIENSRQFPSQLKRDAELRRKWGCYHVIGDALRGVWGSDLSAKICARLDVEPTALAPRWRNTAEKLRRRALPTMAMAAAVVFVAFVGGVALRGVQQDMPPIAAVPKPEVAQVAVPAGEGAKDYLLAHQRYSPATAMQGVTSYVHTMAEVRSADFSIPRIRPGVGVAAKPCLCSE